MASRTKRAKGECDICGFEYPLRSLKKNSYGLYVCPTDYEGRFDLKNHPQNRVANVKDNPSIKDPRPPAFNERGLNMAWEDLFLITWEREYSTTWEDHN